MRKSSKVGKLTNVKKSYYQLNSSLEALLQAYLLKNIDPDQFDIFLKNAPFLAWIKNETGKYLYINKNFDQTSPRAPQPLEEAQKILLLNELENPRRADDERVMNFQEILRAIHHVTAISGKTLSFLTVKFPLIDSNNGKAVGAISIDISEQEIFEEILQELQIRNQQLASQEKALTNMNNELVQMNNSLVASNQELQISKKQLEQANSDLANKNYELDTIVYKISHDIRSPLASILGIVNLIQKEIDPDNFNLYINHIEERALRLDNFVRNMLDFAKINNNLSDAVAIDFQNIISNCFNELSFQKGFDRIQKTVVVNLNGRVFYSDPLKIQIIFSNLISNAIKYQNYYIGENKLEIRIMVKGSSLLIKVNDNGIGIAKKHIAKVIHMFYRATDKSEGSGLGLYIVHQTVNKLNGKLTITSEANKGSQVKIALPLNA